MLARSFGAFLDVVSACAAKGREGSRAKHCGLRDTLNIYKDRERTAEAGFSKEP
jgi:hypothetical protein